MEEGGIPEEWRKGLIIPIFKKDDKDKAENYRGITLIDSGYKIYTEWIRRKLEKELEEGKKLSETQFRFRKSRRTIDATYILRKTVDEELKKKKGKVYACFADLKAAFDKVNREKIWKSPEKLGVQEIIRIRIEQIYCDTECTVKVEGEEIGNFYTTKEMRQGCPLSPTLFNVVMSDIEELSKIQEEGVVLGRKKIWSIAYADDLTLVSTAVEGLKQMLKKLEKVLRRKGLQLT